MWPVLCRGEWLANRAATATTISVVRIQLEFIAALQKTESSLDLSDERLVVTGFIGNK